MANLYYLQHHTDILNSAEESMSDRHHTTSRAIAGNTRLPSLFVIESDYISEKSFHSGTAYPINVYDDSGFQIHQISNQPFLKGVF